MIISAVLVSLEVKHYTRNNELRLAQLNEELLREQGELKKRFQKRRRGVVVLFIVAVPFVFRAYGLPEGLLFLFIIAVFFVALDYWLSRSHRWRIRKLKSDMENIEHN